MENRVLLLHCAQGARKALNKMSQEGYKLNKNVATFELPCMGRINEVMLMQYLEQGFARVMLVACHKVNCQYLQGNLRAEKRLDRLQNILDQAGIENKKLKLVFVAPDESQKLSTEIEDFLKKTNKATTIIK